MPYVSGQINFEDGDLGYKVKVTVTKKLKNTKKFAKNSNMHIFEFYLCHRIVYDITVILMPNMFISYKTQAQKINDKIWKKK